MLVSFGLERRTFSDLDHYWLVIGYGKMSPASLPAHLLVTFESFCGLIGVRGHRRGSRRNDDARHR